MSYRDSGNRDGDRRSGSSPQRGGEDWRGQGGDERRERGTDSGARRDHRSRSPTRGSGGIAENADASNGPERRDRDHGRLRSPISARRSRSPLRENDRGGQRSGNVGRSNSRYRRSNSRPRRQSRSRDRSQDAQPSEAKDPIAAIRESLGGETKLSSFLAEEPKTIRDYMDSKHNIVRSTETVVESLVPKQGRATKLDADVPVVYETLVPVMAGTNPSLSGASGALSMQGAMARNRISKWDNSSGGAGSHVWELAQKLAAEQAEKRKVAEAPCTRYAGTFTHPQFGEEPIDIEVNFDTQSSGSWTAVFQTTEIVIKRSGQNGKNIIMSETSGDPAGDTRLEGEFDEDGEIAGDVFQGGEGGGQFVLYPRPKSSSMVTQLVAFDSGSTVPYGAFESLKPLKNPTGLGGTGVFDCTASLSGPAPAQYGPPKHTIVIGEAALSGLLGKNGESIRQIELSTGAVIKLGRTESHGNLCRMYGELDCAQLAADLMNARLAHILNPSPSSDVEWLKTQSGNASSNDAMAEDIEYQHVHLGRTLGKDVALAAKVIGDIGAFCQFEQEQGPDGPEKLRIVGRRDQVALAKRLVQKRLEEALTIRLGAEPSFAPEACSEIKVEQQFAAWIFGGKNKAHMIQIADRSGASIQVKHGILLEGGCSIIKISGPQGAHDAALVRVNMRIDQSKEYQEKRKLQCMVGDWVCPLCGDQNFRRNEVCRHCNCPRPAGSAEAAGPTGHAQHKAGFLKAEGDDAFQVEQRCVGYLIGPGGATLKEIKDMSGAIVFVDQETRDQGFSIIRIGGKNSPEAIVARELLEKKIGECLSRFQNLTRGPTQPYEKNKEHPTPVLLPGPPLPPMMQQAMVQPPGFAVPQAFQGNPMHYTQNAPPILEGPDYSDFMMGMDCTLFNPTSDVTQDVTQNNSMPTVYPGCFAVKNVEHMGADKGCSKGSDSMSAVYPGCFADQYKGSEKGCSKGKGEDSGGMDFGKGKDSGGMDFGKGKGKDKSWSDGAWSAAAAVGAWDPWADLPGGPDLGKGKGKDKSWSDSAWLAAGAWSKGAAAPYSKGDSWSNGDSWGKGSW